jgi:NCS1 family nucleobase:cation symporter-1
VISIGLALLGAYGVIVNVGDWGWLIGAVLGGVLYLGAARSLGQDRLGNAPSLARET